MKKAYCSTCALSLLVSVVALTLVVLLGITGLGMGSVMKEFVIELKRRNDIEENTYDRPRTRDSTIQRKD